MKALLFGLVAGAALGIAYRSPVVRAIVSEFFAPDLPVRKSSITSVTNGHVDAPGRKVS